MKIKFRREFFQINIVLFLIILSEYLFMIAAIPYDSYIIMALALLGYMVLARKLTERGNRLLLCCLILIVACAIVSHKYNGNINLPGCLANAVFFSGTLLMMNTEIDMAFPKLFYWLIVVSLFGYFVIHRNYEQFFTGISRNYVSVIMIYAVSYIVIAAEHKKERIPIVYFILPLVFSFLAVGRGGIIACSYMMAAHIFIQSQKAENKKRRRVYRALVVIAFLLVVIVFSNEEIVGKLFSRFVNSGTVDEARTNIWSRYFGLIGKSKNNLLYGPTINQDAYLRLFSLNMHNSVLTMHSRYGLIYTVINIVMAVGALVWYLKQKKWTMFVMLSTLLLRGLTDAVFGSYWGDIFWWYFLLYPVVCSIRQKGKRNNASSIPIEV